MLTLERDGSLRSDGRDNRAKETIGLPATLMMYDGDLIDRIFEVVFERLSRFVIELRLRMGLTQGRPVV
jgi:hypothetical protein